MELFTAKKAKKIKSKLKEADLNVQRIHFLKCIKNAANEGLTSIMTDDPYFVLFPEDYLFFESLGYEVTWSGKVRF